MKIKQFLLDSFFGWYVAITMHRVIWLKVIYPDSYLAFSWDHMVHYVTAAFAFAIFSAISGASVSKKIFDSLEKPWQNSVASHITWMMISLTFITGWVVTKVSIIDLISQERLEAAGRIFSALVTPDFSILEEAIFAIIETIYLAFMATALALPLSFVLAFLSARNLMKDHWLTFSIYNAVRIFTNFTRSIEPLVWAVIFTVWVKVGPFPGMLALMVHTISSLAKQYSEQIEDIDQGPMEAIEATGAKPLQVIWYAVVPQVVIPFLSFTIYRWDINVRMATVIGLVGGGGIGTMLVQYQMLAQWHHVGLIVLLIAIVVWIMDWLSAKIREALA